MNREQFGNLTYLLHQKWDYMGIKNVKGARLVAHAPSIAEEAWMHKIYNPLNEKGLHQLEQMLGSSIPSDLKMLYSFANGLNLFTNHLVIYGLKTSYDRTGDLYEPYNIHRERDTASPLSPKSWFYFGSFNSDLLFFDTSLNNQKIYLTERGKVNIIKEWDSLYDFLLIEIQRLNELHDEQGRMPGVKYVSDILREIAEENKPKKRKKKK